MNKYFNPMMGILLLGLIFNLTSCQTTVNRSSGEGRYSLKRSLTMPNYWEVLVNGDVGSVYGAVLEGINDLGLKVYESKADDLSGVVNGSFADTTEYEIRLSYEEREVTLMLIRVGLLGNQELSIEIFKAAEKHL